MNRRFRWLALPAGFGLALMLTTSAFAYVGQVPKTVTVIPSSGTFKCDQWYLVRAKVLDQNGNPIKNLTVTWSFAQSPSSQDRIRPATSKTDKHGLAMTHVKFACVLGDRTIRATTDGISGTAVVHVKLRGHDDQHVLGITGVPGLPNTSTLAADSSTGGVPAPALPAIVALLATLAIIARRPTFTRR